jgi:DHA2 family multidrug resistance protein
VTANLAGYEGEAERVSLRAWVAVIGGVFGCFMAGMNVHVTNASLPQIEGSLGATFDEGSWITTSYLVAEIIIIPLTAWLVDVFSMRRVLLVGTTGFLIFSLACSFTLTLNTMILARVLQGAFGGVLIPLSFQLIVTELPSSKHPLGMALFAIANNVAQAAGPSLGGWLTDSYSWRWIFYLQVPPALVLLAAISWSIGARAPNLQSLKHGDWWGIAAMAIGLGTLQIVLEEGGRRDWFGSDFIMRMTAISIAALITFIIIELRRDRPFINLRLLLRYNFGLASLMQFLFGAAVFGVVFLVPNYLAQVHGYSAHQVGMTMIPYGSIQLVMSFLAPVLMRKTSARMVIAAGFAIAAAGCFMNVHLDSDSAGNVIVPSLIVRGVGQSLIVVALSSMAVVGLEKSQVGSASGLFNMVRNLGGAIGTAVIGQIVVEREKLHSERIGDAVSFYDPATQERIIEGVRMFAGQHVGRLDALVGLDVLPYRLQAIASLDGAIRRQAFLMAYSDAFLAAGMALALCAVISFALRSPRPR